MGYHVLVHDGNGTEYTCAQYSIQKDDVSLVLDLLDWVCRPIDFCVNVSWSVRDANSYLLADWLFFVWLTFMASTSRNIRYKRPDNHMCILLICHLEWTTMAILKIEMSDAETSYQIRPNLQIEMSGALQRPLIWNPAKLRCPVKRPLR